MHDFITQLISQVQFQKIHSLSFITIFTSNFPMLFHFFPSSLQTFQCSFISFHLHFKLSNALSFLSILTSNFPMPFHFFSSSLQTFQCSSISLHLHFKLSNALSFLLIFNSNFPMLFHFFSLNFFFPGNAMFNGKFDVFII